MPKAATSRRFTTNRVAVAKPRAPTPCRPRRIRYHPTDAHRAFGTRDVPGRDRADSVTADLENCMNMRTGRSEARRRRCSPDCWSLSLCCLVASWRVTRSGRSSRPAGRSSSCGTPSRRRVWAIRLECGSTIARLSAISPTRAASTRVAPVRHFAHAALLSNACSRVPGAVASRPRALAFGIDRKSDALSQPLRAPESQARQVAELQALVSTLARQGQSGARLPRFDHRRADGHVAGTGGDGRS